MSDIEDISYVLENEVDRNPVLPKENPKQGDERLAEICRKHLEKIFNRKNLNKIFQKDTPYLNGRLIEFFSRKFPDEYTALSSEYSTTGQWEGYTVAGHSKMVMDQFDKYFSSTPLPLDINHSFFKVFIALHDIGKLAATKAGGRHLQHVHTPGIMKAALEELDFSKKEIDIAMVLVSHDYIGDCVKGGNYQDILIKIQDLADEYDLPAKELLNLMILFYKVDAGSYTEDAEGGGKIS
jgi:CMP-2-keto-3-deoxyoctulosonic acid synthetase